MGKFLWADLARPNIIINILGHLLAIAMPRKVSSDFIITIILNEKVVQLWWLLRTSSRKKKSKVNNSVSEIIILLARK